MPSPRGPNALPLLAVLLCALPARAQTPTTAPAEALIEEGLALRQKGQDEAALPLFRRAHELHPTPRASAQLGFVEQAVGAWIDAEVHLSQALAAGADPWVKQQRELIDESLRFVKGHLGWLELRTNVSGAAVVVDGRTLGTTPLAQSLRLPAGKHTLEVRATGHEDERRAFAIAAGKTARLALDLRRLPAPSSTTSPSPLAHAPLPAAAPPAAALVTAPAPDVRAPNEARPPYYRRWWFWTGIGAIALGATAIALTTTRPADPFPCGGAGRVCAE